jgi:hypothetical protein
MPPRGYPERDWDTIGRDDEVQSPPEELLPLGGAVAAIRRPAHLGAPPRAGAAADGQRHAVDHEDLSRGEGRRQEVDGVAQAMGEGVEAAIEAGERERAGEVAHAAQDAQGTLVVVGELAGGDHPDGEHFAIAGLGATIGAMPHRAQQVVKHAVDGSNQRVVHRRFLPRRAVSAPPFSGMTPMNDD